MNIYRKNQLWAKNYLKRYDLNNLKTRKIDENLLSGALIGKPKWVYINPRMAAITLSLLKPIETRTRPKRVSKKRRLIERRGPKNG